MNTARRRRTATTGTTSAPPHAIGHNVNRVVDIKQWQRTHIRYQPHHGAIHTSVVVMIGAYRDIHAKL